MLLWQKAFAAAVKEWKASSEIFKKNYVLEAQRLQVQFERDTVEWEKQMIAEGRYDVLRKSTLATLRFDLVYFCSPSLSLCDAQVYAHHTPLV